MDDTLLVGEVTEVRGVRLRARIYSNKNESHLFYRGKLVRNVSVGGYVKIPYGYDSIVGVIEGDFQQEARRQPDYAERTSAGELLERFVDISVFGVMSKGRFDRGVNMLPLVESKVYVLSPEELEFVSSQEGQAVKAPFRVGALAGHNGVSVVVPTSALFASHIGVFGNTGSGKSNTLCRLYTNLFDSMDDAGTLPTTKSRFVFLDFNGEYVQDGVLSSRKATYRLNTRTAGDRIPVPENFYFDLEIWSVLTQATEKTQRPFLGKCLETARRIREASNKTSYMAAMVRNFVRGYFGKESLFPEQKKDLEAMLALALSSGKRSDRESEVAATFAGIEPYTRSPIPKLKSSNEVYGDTEDKVEDIFRSCLDLPFDFDYLASNIITLLEFVSRYVFLEKWRSGSIVHDHIAGWLPRYSKQLEESSKIYGPAEAGILNAPNCPVVVYSLLNVNQDQKKVIPLVIAKYLYHEQKERGAEDAGGSVHLVIDEAHNILSYSSQRESETWRDYRLETFEEIVKEGRKFGMYLTVSSQRPSDISSTIISQMHNYFIHRLVNDEDLKAIGKAVSFIDAANASMIPVLPQGACIMSGTAAPYPMRVQVDKLLKEKQPQSFDRDLAKTWGLEK